MRYTGLMCRTLCTRVSSAPPQEKRKSRYVKGEGVYRRHEFDSGCDGFSSEGRSFTVPSLLLREMERKCVYGHAIGGFLVTE